MAIKLSQGFQITSASSIDSRLTLSKSQMLSYNLNLMPDLYLALCTDDKKFYIFDKTATPSAETGYFVPYEEKIDLPGAITAAMQTEEGKAAIENAVGLTLPGALSDAMSTSEKAQQIADALFASDHFSVNLDNKIDLAISVIEAIDGN